LGYRGELVLAERFERSLDRLSTCFLCRLGYASRCASWDRDAAANRTAPAPALHFV
jgi:hypothetical protein